MSNARNLADLLDSTGDVKSGALDNVPASPDEITKSSSNPTITTNGSVGDLWLNSTSGEMYVLTDATTDNNIWTNVGSGIGNVTGPYSVDFLVIGGGGGASKDRAGGGGAGGYRNSYNSETSGRGSTSESSLTFNGGTTYTITVGAGATGIDVNTTGPSGNWSAISGSGITTITSNGGGGGGTRGVTSGQNGGCGGGASNDNSASGGSGTSGQGYDGGANAVNDGGIAAGGGGAGQAGADGNGASSNRGKGGDGLASSITGSSVTRAGGGGGGSQTGYGSGGTGGGGNGGTDQQGGTSGTVNTGSGGGGGGNGVTLGGSGGSGIVILRMDTSNYSGNTSGGPTVTTDGSDTILTFTGSGSYIA